jgi:hypothetical protein
MGLKVCDANAARPEKDKVKNNNAQLSSLKCKLST